MLGVLLRQAMWAMMLRREGLAILNQVYTFIHAHYNTNAILPASVRTELFHIKALLPLFRCSVRSSASGSDARLPLWLSHLYKAIEFI